MHAFRGVFLAAGRPCTLRVSKGDDEMAACGQLGNVNLAARPAPLLKPPQALAGALQAQAPGQPLHSGSSDVVGAC